MKMVALLVAKYLYKNQPFFNPFNIVMKMEKDIIHKRKQNIIYLCIDLTQNVLNLYEVEKFLMGGGGGPNNVYTYK
jgi:hypothetical protein